MEVSGLNSFPGLPAGLVKALPTTKDTRTSTFLEVNPDGDIRYRSEFGPSEIVEGTGDPEIDPLVWFRYVLTDDAWRDAPPVREGSSCTDCRG